MKPTISIKSIKENGWLSNTPPTMFSRGNSLPLKAEKTMDDIRWQQRFNSYQKALSQLDDAVQLSTQRPLLNLEQQGLIKVFEFTYELAWNLLRDYFKYQGNSDIIGSRDAIREAFQTGLIYDGENWMEMIKSRNKSSHTYNEEVANEIAHKIITVYHELFQELVAKFESL